MLRPLSVIALRLSFLAARARKALALGRGMVPPQELGLNWYKVGLIDGTLAELEQHGLAYWIFHPRKFRYLRKIAAEARRLNWQTRPTIIDQVKAHLGKALAEVGGQNAPRL